MIKKIFKVLFLLLLILDLLDLAFLFAIGQHFDIYILDTYNWNLLFEFLGNILYLYMAIFYAVIYGIFYAFTNRKYNKYVVTIYITFYVVMFLMGVKTGYQVFVSEIRTKIINLAEVSQVDNPFDMKQNTSLYNSENKMVVLIIVESLSNKFIGKNTQNINSYVDEYGSIELAPVGDLTLDGVMNTLCSHTSITESSKEEYDCLPKILNGNNVFIRGASKYIANEDVFFTKYGFNEIYAKEDFIADGEFIEGFGANDNLVFNKAFDYMEDGYEFITILTLDTHSDNHRCFIKETETLEQNINCLDIALGSFLERFEKDYGFDDNIVLIVSDHLHPFIREDGDKLFFMMLNNYAELIMNYGSQLDIAPTILDYLDFNVPVYFMGSSLITNNNK